MKVKRVVLHFGINKTGSTSIQKTLFSNSTVLEKNGFKYLNEWGEHHWDLFRILFQPHPEVYPNEIKLSKVFVEKNRQRYKKNLCKILTNVINTTESETLILSGVYYGSYYLDSAVENLKNFIEEYFTSKGIETRIILFARNPLTHLISRFQQKLSPGDLEHGIERFEQIKGGILSYEGIWSLKIKLNESVTVLKFEDAVKDEDGLVGFFLKAIGFPKEQLRDLKVITANESRSQESIELINYIEEKEPIYPFGKNKPVNINREKFGNDLIPIMKLEGLKFDLPHEDKLVIWELVKETVNHLKEHAGVDYTDYKIPPPRQQETYSEETIKNFIDVFPKLSPAIQKLFLEYFEKKYTETGDSKFQKLYSKGSVPWQTHASISSGGWLIWRIKKMLYVITTHIKTLIKLFLGRRVARSKVFIRSSYNIKPKQQGG